MNGWMDLFTGAGVVTAIGIVRWRTLFNTRVYLWPGTTAVFDISCPLKNVQYRTKKILL